MIYILRSKQITDNLIEQLNKIAYGDGRFVYCVDIKKHREARTKSQNAMMHMWFTFMAKQHYLNGSGMFTAKAWKVMLKEKFLGEEVIELPDGRRRAETKHTADLSVKEMSEFLETIDHFVGAEHNIQLPHPHDYNLAMGL